MRFKKLGVVARGGIEPPTRGFSVRRRARLGAGKLKIRKSLPVGRPNRPARPSLSRTGMPLARSGRRSAHAGQRLARVRTELFPNRARRCRDPVAPVAPATGALLPFVDSSLYESG